MAKTKTEIKDNTVTEVTELTPTEYFDKLKGMKKDITEEYILQVLDNCLELMKRPKMLGQKKMVKKIYEQSQILIRELEVVKAGFQTYVLRDDIVYYIDKIAKKPVKIIELENYEREIPEEVADKVISAQDLFDEFFVVFTDYTGEAERTVEKEKRDKDPILFGVIHHPDTDRVPTNRLYYIADWVDEYCDLTLEELCNQYKSDGNKKSILYINSIPKDINEIKEAFKQQAEDYKLDK